MVFRGSGRSLCAAQHVDVGHVLLISGQGTVQILRQCWGMRCLGLFAIRNELRARAWKSWSNGQSGCIRLA